MRKRRHSSTCVLRAPSIKRSLQLIIKILQWCSKYHGDDQNTTVMLRILQWCSKYHGDDQNTTVMLRIFQWCSKNHGDDQITTVMLRILQWCSKYYIDAPDITDAESKKKREVSGKMLCRDTQELVGDQKGTDRVCAGPHDYIYQNIGMFWARINHKLDIILEPKIIPAIQSW
jgi:hypothetical protein